MMTRSPMPSTSEIIAYAREIDSDEYEYSAPARMLARWILDTVDYDLNHGNPQKPQVGIGESHHFVKVQNMPGFVCDDLRWLDAHETQILTARLVRAAGLLEPAPPADPRR